MSQLKRTDLDQILALGLGNKRLELGSGKGVDQASLRDDQQEHLRAGKNREFICL
jgi:hypothetical protein